MAPNGFNAYKNNSVTTQTPGQIVVMLYEGAIKFLKGAADAIERKDFAEKGRLMGRALDIISELNAVLNVEAGGEVAQNLRKLYVFMHQHLATASIKKDPKAIRQVIKLLEDLNSGWKQIAA